MCEVERWTWRRRGSLYQPPSFDGLLNPHVSIIWFSPLEGGRITMTAGCKACWLCCCNLRCNYSSKSNYICVVCITQCSVKSLVKLKQLICVLYWIWIIVCGTLYFWLLQCRFMTARTIVSYYIVGGHKTEFVQCNITVITCTLKLWLP